MQYQLYTAATLREALDYLTGNTVDIILCDLSLPDSQGQDTFRKNPSPIPEDPP